MIEDTAQNNDGDSGWEAPDRDLAPSASEALIVDVAGFEGPPSSLAQRASWPSWPPSSLLSSLS
jgi:hypothetical protein